MSLIIGFLTFILVVNCLFLMLLVLVQLPKKEAGAGLAFGGGATDALFGAGSGNALTKMTKYAAASFLGLALVLTILNTRRVGSSVDEIERELARRGAEGAAVVPQQPIAPAVSTNQGLTPLTNNLRPLTPSVEGAATTPNATTAAPDGAAASAPGTAAPAPAGGKAE